MNIFVLTSLNNGETIDIVEDKRLKSLTSYFHRFSRKARLKVKGFIIDM